MKRIYLLFVIGTLLIACQTLDNKGNNTISTSLPLTPIIEENVFANLEGELLFVCQCEPANSSIYYLNIESEKLLRLTQGNIYSFDPQWIPGSDTFVFTSQADEKFSLNLMNLDKGNIASLGDDKFSNFRPTISPDGEDLVFVSDRDGDLELYLFNFQNQIEVQLTNNEIDDDYPSWSPDGNAIAFISYPNGYENLNLLNKATNQISTLVEGSPLVHGFGFHLVWSPSGERLVFEATGDMLSDIFVVDRDESNLQQLTTYQKTDYQPVWSSDGKWIAFHSNRDSNYGIYLIEIDTMQMYQFARGDFPVWTLEGQYLLFVSEDAEFTDNIVALHIESQEYRIIYEGNGSINNPVLRP